MKARKKPWADEAHQATTRLLEAILPANEKGWHSHCDIDLCFSGEFVGVIAIRPPVYLPQNDEANKGWIGTTKGKTVAEVENNLAAYVQQIIDAPPYRKPA